MLAFLDMGLAEMVVCGFVALVLFGGRLPEVMRNLGATYRNFRSGMEDLKKQAGVDVRMPSITAPKPYPPMPAPTPDPAMRSASRPAGETTLGPALTGDDALVPRKPAPEPAPATRRDDDPPPV